MSERTDRFEEQVATVIGVARQACDAWLATHKPGVQFEVGSYELAMFELHHAIGVLDMDGLEPDDE